MQNTRSDTRSVYCRAKYHDHLQRLNFDDILVQTRVNATLRKKRVYQPRCPHTMAIMYRQLGKSNRSKRDSSEQHWSEAHQDFPIEHALLSTFFDPFAIDVCIGLTWEIWPHTLILKVHIAIQTEQSIRYHRSRQLHLLSLLASAITSKISKGYCET